MDLEPSPEQEQLRASVRAFLADRAPIRPFVRDALDRERWAPDPVWADLAALGVVGLLAPEDRGGGGAPLETMSIALEEAGRALLPAPLVTTGVGAVVALRDLVPHDASDPWLGRLAAGEAVGSVAIDHGRPWSGRSGIDVRRDPQGRARLDGTVRWVPYAAEADVLVVAATEGHRQQLHLVALPADGCSFERHDHADRLARFATVHLDSVLGSPFASVEDDALTRLVDTIALAWIAEALGAGDQALELTVAYATERQQFGAPIGSFQAVQHLCADMLRDLELTRGALQYACWASDARVDLDAVERRRSVLVAQAVAAEALPRVGATAIQVHGGIGFTWDHDIHLFHKRLLTIGALFGTEGDHLDALAGLVIAGESPHPEG